MLQGVMRKEVPDFTPSGLEARVKKAISTISREKALKGFRKEFSEEQGTPKLVEWAYSPEYRRKFDENAVSFQDRDVMMAHPSYPTVLAKAGEIVAGVKNGKLPGDFPWLWVGIGGAAVGLWFWMRRR